VDCCDKMKDFLDEGKVAIVYSPKFRNYSIELRNSQAAQAIYFCPWCGIKFPSDLSKLLGEIIFDELDLDDFQDPRMPEEFKTDEWWKKRGL
jgi:hypothetical protein